MWMDVQVCCWNSGLFHWLVFLPLPAMQVSYWSHLITHFWTAWQALHNCPTPISSHPSLLISDPWLLTHHFWPLTFDLWPFTPDLLPLISDLWLLIPDLWFIPLWRTFCVETTYWTPVSYSTISVQDIWIVEHCMPCLQYFSLCLATVSLFTCFDLDFFFFRSSVRNVTVMLPHLRLCLHNFIISVIELNQLRSASYQ